MFGKKSLILFSKSFLKLRTVKQKLMKLVVIKVGRKSSLICIFLSSLKMIKVVHNCCELYGVQTNCVFKPSNRIFVIFEKKNNVTIDKNEYPH